MACSPKMFHRPFRSKNKEPIHLDPCPPLFDDHQHSLFEEYIESGFFEPSDGIVGTAHSDDSSESSAFATSSGRCNDAALPANARHRHAAAATCQGSTASLDQKLHLPHMDDPSEPDEDDHINVNQVSLEDFSCAAPASPLAVGVQLSPPPSPTLGLSVTKKRIALPIRTITGAKSPIRKLQRMCSQSPTKMMSPRHQRVGTYHGAWAKKLEAASEKFNTQMPSQPPISPSHRGSVHQSPRARTFVPSDFRGFDAAPLITPNLEEPPPSTGHAMYNPYFAHAHSQALLTPLTSPTFPLQSPVMDMPPQQQQAQSLNPTSTHLHGNHDANAALLRTPPPSQKLHSSAWKPDPQDFFDYSYSATSPSLTDPRAEAWWNAASAMQRGHQSGNCSANPGLIGLGLQGFAASDMESQNALGPCDMSNLAFDSLMQSSAVGMPEMGSAAFASPFLLSPVPALMPSTPITPITPSHAYHRSRNSSASPTPVTPSSRHMRGASRSHRRSQSQHHRRRPSVRDPDLSSVAAQAKGGGGGGGGRDKQGSANVGFVNFTPDDSRKILTGVAPSGSSKTKARREKEAQEKRRKLSEAAMRAVVEAGGDVERLEREGLLASIMAADA